MSFFECTKKFKSCQKTENNLGPSLISRWFLAPPPVETTEKNYKPGTGHAQVTVCPCCLAPGPRHLLQIL